MVFIASARGTVNALIDQPAPTHYIASDRGTVNALIEQPAGLVYTPSERGKVNALIGQPSPPLPYVASARGKVNAFIGEPRVFDMWHFVAGTRKPMSLFTTLGRILAGAVPIGTAVYDIPTSDVWYVSTTGSDSNSGSFSAPKATLTAAINSAVPGATIVVRGGVYPQMVSANVTKVLTIQNYPNETVWFDGSDVVTGWAASGSRWVRTGWTVKFDHSASYTYGSNAGNFVNTSYPLAAWPDQVWIDDVRQDIVASNPAPGQFSVDYTANTLTLGSDPTGKTVRATARATFLVIAAAVTLLGIGIRCYGTPVPAFGMVNIVSAGTNSRIENCHFYECASQLLSISSNNTGRTVVTRNTFRGGGMTGVHSNNVNGAVYTLSNNIIDDTNWRHFNIQPASAAVRTSRSLNALVANNIVTNTQGGGIWFDVYSRRTSIVNNLVDGVADMGICYEISQWAIITGNRIRNSAKQSILVLASSDVEVWNNEVDRGTQFDIAFKDDARSNSEFGVVVYVQRGVMRNNVFANRTAKSSSGWRSVTYDSNLAIVSDDMMGTDAISGNVYVADQAPTAATSAARMFGWAASVGVGPTGYSTPAAFAAVEPDVAGTNVLVQELSPSDSLLSSLASTVAYPLPSEVASLYGASISTGALILGPPSPAPIPIA